MKKKIGIVTFHRSRNYGAVLQTYALQKTLEDMDCIPEVIDYENPKIAEGLTLWNMPQTFQKKDIMFAMKQFIFRFRKKIAFDAFLHKYISLTEKRYKKQTDLAELSGAYQLLITGSDQVWNEELTDNDEVYYLDFDAEDIPKVAYAVSAGDKLQINRKRTGNAVEAFFRISVREQVLQDFLQKMHNYTAAVCCDPTFLIETSRFLELVKKRPYRKKYIFLYMIQDSKELYEQAQKLACKNNLVLICNKNCIPFFMKCSPTDFLTWIYHAEYIITNSFHGTCFSIHFEKQFIVEAENRDGGKNQRVLDLLERLHMWDRIMTYSEEEDKNWKKLMDKIDYSEVKLHMEAMKTESRNWLWNAIEQKE